MESRRLFPGRARIARPGITTAVLTVLALPLCALASDTSHRHHDAATDPFAGATTLDRSSLVAAVLARNPSIEASREAWRAVSSLPTRERAFDDPMIGYSLAPRSIGVSEMTFGQTIEFGQKLPFPGKRGLRAAAATAEARAAEGDYESVRRETALMASLLFDEYYAATRAIEINEKHGVLLEEMIESAKASYVAGRIPQHTLVRVELQLAHVLHDAVEVRTERDVARAALNALLRRPPAATLPPPPLRVSPPDLPGDPRAWIEEAHTHRPEAATARARIDAAKARVELARREYFPDLTVGGEYNTMWEDEKHRLMLGLQVEVPLQFGRRNADLAAAEAEAASRRAEWTATLDRIAAEVEIASMRFHEAKHIVELYRDHLVPASRDAVASARAGLTAGIVEFSDLIDAEHEARDIELEHEMSLAALGRRRAELERSIGRIPGVTP